MTLVLSRLRELRRAAGLTQQELAKEVGVRRATISDLERGRSRRLALDLLDRLARALAVRPGQLLEQLEQSLPRPKRKRARRSR